MAEKRKSPGGISVTKSITGSGDILPLDFSRQFSDSCNRGVAFLTEEMSRFLQARWQSDFDAWKALVGCRSANEILDCQQRFAERVIDDYFDEIGRLSRLAMDTAAASLSAFQRPTPSAPKAKVAEVV